MSRAPSHDARPDLVIHLGFPKTATTALQRGVFPLDPALAYLGKQARSERANRITDRFVRRLVSSSDRF